MKPVHNLKMMAARIANMKRKTNQTSKWRKRPCRTATTMQNGPEIATPLGSPTANLNSMNS
jgi:hypothetical protein